MTPALPIVPRHRLTKFQKKVYLAVLSIPKGQTRSYGWVAAKAGSPGAYRAVGNALGRNPWPVRVPCHRVIRSDGSIGGYYKGAALKRRILRREKGLTLGPKR